jgi:hypothetical protein
MHVNLERAVYSLAKFSASSIYQRTARAQMHSNKYHIDLLVMTMLGVGLLKGAAEFANVPAAVVISSNHKI